MLQVSLVGLVVGGAALSMAYYDGFIVVLVVTAALLHVVRQPRAQAAPALARGWKAVAAQAPVPVRS